jgi:hypothetical protein
MKTRILSIVILLLLSTVTLFAVDPDIQANNQLDASDAIKVWNHFRQFGEEGGDEFISRHGTEITMNFNYNSASALTQTSLANRLAKAIKKATGIQLDVEVYTGFAKIKSAFKRINNGKSVTSDMQFTLIPKTGAAYCVWMPVTITLNSKASSDLNGNDAKEPDPTPLNISRPTSTGVRPSPTGITVTDSRQLLPNDIGGMASHSCHELRVLRTANKTFAVMPVETIGDFVEVINVRLQ